MDEDATSPVASTENLTTEYAVEEAAPKNSALFSMDVASHKSLQSKAIGIAWIHGPLSSSAQYMDDSTVAVLCGSHICFSCSAFSQTEVFTPDARGASTLATNGVDLFAVSETCIKPAVIVYTYPDLEEHAKLEDGAELEYVCVRFAPSSERLAAISGVPDYSVFLWDLSSQVMVARLELGVAQSLQLSFCDLDTPHIAVTSDRGATILRMEHFGPNDWRLTPRHARLAPVKSHVWTVTGNLFCASHNQIYQVNADTMEVAVLDVDQWCNSGNIGAMVLTKRGIFAALDDGRIMLCEPNESGSCYMTQIVADMERAISDLHPSPNYNFIAVTCRDGQVHLLYVPSVDHSPLGAYQIDQSPAVDAVLLGPTLEKVVSIHAPHTIHVWNAGVGSHEASEELQGKLSCIASNPMHPIVFVGNDESCLFAIDLVLPLQPRIVWAARITESPVAGLHVSGSGRVGAVFTEDGQTYLLSTLPSAGLGILAQLETDGRPTACDSRHVSDLDADTDVFAFLVTTRLELLSFIRMVIVRDGEVAGSVTYGLDTVYVGLALLENTAYCMAVHDRRLSSFNLRPFATLLEDQVSDLLWRPDARCDSGHQLRSVQLRTCAGHVLVSINSDGVVRGRPADLGDLSTGPLSDRHARQTHQPISGGIRSMALHPDGTAAALVGHDGTLLRLSLPYQPGPKAQRRKSSFFDTKPPEAEYLARLPHITSWELTKPRPSWAEVAEEASWRKQADEMFQRRAHIEAGIDKLRHQVQKMLDANMAMEELDQLPEHEFELDLEEQARLEAASAKRVQQVRDGIIDQNARNMYVRDQLKKQCWDAMEVKGKAIMGLMAELEVSNYPLVGRSAELQQLLDSLQERRQLEVAERQLQSQLLQVDLDVAPPTAASANMPRSSTVSAASGMLPASSMSITASQAPMQVPVEEGGESDDEEDGTPQPVLSHTGSTSHALGVTNVWMFPQFEICTRKQRVEQIHMLRDNVYQLKVKFNERFEEVYQTKCGEVRRIGEWADRLQYIYKELKMDEQPWRPQWTAYEQPETLLTVKDEEVLVERYYTPAERARMDAAAAEEERRRREREANDFRERAIMHMMNGVLEIRWEDTLKEDVPRPEFMDLKEPEEWTEEEQREAAEYEQKCIQLEADREKYRKMLEVEVKKLIVTVQETVDKFDHTLVELFNLKVQTEMAIDQEELKVDRMLRDIAEEDHRAKRERQLCHQMEETQQRKVALQAANADLKRALEVARAGHEPLVQQERILDKSFRKEFPDQPSSVIDVLYRYFRRRPPALRRHLEAAGKRGTLLEEGAIEVEHRKHARKHSRKRSRGTSKAAGHHSKSPAGSQPARRGHHGRSRGGARRAEQQHTAADASRAAAAGAAGAGQRAGPATVMANALRGGSPYLPYRKTVPGKHEILVAMRPLDGDSERSPELEHDVWHLMCQLRTNKVLAEFELLRSSAEVAALVDSIEQRQHAEEAMSQRMQNLIAELAELRENRLKRLHDQEVQLVLRQGQVEVDLGDFCPNFDGAGLINRVKVELLNKQILGIGDQKLDVMRDALRFRRGIVMQRWEYQRCRMTLEDYVQKLKDIAFMKVTRAIQQYLMEGSDTTEKQIMRLERRMDILRAQSDGQRREDGDTLQYLQRLLRIKRLDNNRLALEARELNVDVSERELLYDIRCNHQRKWQARQRLNNMRKIKELVDIASFQQRYMAMLHGELQRLYGKTYPMLHAI